MKTVCVCAHEGRHPCECVSVSLVRNHSTHSTAARGEGEIRWVVKKRVKGHRRIGIRVVVPVCECCLSQAFRLVLWM